MATSIVIAAEDCWGLAHGDVADHGDEKIDLYILLKPDIEWEEDPVRENPHIREYLYEWYKKEIEQIGTNYVEIGGEGSIRTKRALRAINKLKSEKTQISD